MVVPYAKNEGMNMVANLAVVITFCGLFKGQKYVFALMSVIHQTW